MSGNLILLDIQVMNIRKSLPSDIESIMLIYDCARQQMRDGGNTTQWVNGYPQRELILKDIAEGNHYVCESDGIIVAVFSMIFGDDPTYSHIEGRWLNAQPYATIHRIGSDGRVKGVLHEVVSWAFSYTDNLRIDTHADNAPMLHLMEREAFSYCGIIYVADGTPRKAFQKTVR